MTTMKHKTAELTGALLDAAVAKAEGFVPWMVNPNNKSLCVGVLSETSLNYEVFAPSQIWGHGGPIIERERIQLDNAKDSDAPAEDRCYFWMATIYSPFWEPSRPDVHGDGPTPLIAAMRAYVAAKLGDEVELPD